ncbi:hypothetical protein PanWU01x14_187340 [Parasponia andersonii]|uniref:Uncharacterized protein n=1 Tax=Parasponia andersonii TaxID=3476 RepID=A0A2P5C3K9_PARAD|nr:hypothetical protein PanWU01x14_187340 [Parasponia andersonii]
MMVMKFMPKQCGFRYMLFGLMKLDVVSSE